MALQKPRVASCLGGRDEEHRPGIDIIYHNGRMEAVDKTLGTRHGLSWRTAGAKRQLRARGDVVDHLQHPVALIPAPPEITPTRIPCPSSPARHRRVTCRMWATDDAPDRSCANIGPGGAQDRCYRHDAAPSHHSPSSPTFHPKPAFAHITAPSLAITHPEVDVPRLPYPFHPCSDKRIAVVLPEKLSYGTPSPKSHRDSAFVPTA
jgi:hypothetical protein